MATQETNHTKIISIHIISQLQCSYSGILHMRKCIVRKQDTKNFEEVSVYKKVLSLNEFHFQFDTSMILYETINTKTRIDSLHKKIVRLISKKWFLKYRIPLYLEYKDCSTFYPTPAILHFFISASK